VPNVPSMSPTEKPGARPAVIPTVTLFAGSQGVGQPRREAAHVGEVAQEPGAPMRRDRVVAGDPGKTEMRCARLHLSRARLRGANGALTTP
jgi:hypothetical protein